MKKIKAFIIHLFGGYTQKETSKRFTQGLLFALQYHKDFMNTLYGKPAEEWCRIAYDEVTKNIESVKKSIATEGEQK